MSATGLGIWTCYLQQVTLFGDVVEPLGDGAWLEEVLIFCSLAFSVNNF